MYISLVFNIHLLIDNYRYYLYYRLHEKPYLTPTENVPVAVWVWWEIPTCGIPMPNPTAVPLCDQCTLHYHHHLISYIKWANTTWFCILSFFCLLLCTATNWAGSLFQWCGVSHDCRCCSPLRDLDKFSSINAEGNNWLWWCVQELN